MLLFLWDSISFQMLLIFLTIFLLIADYLKRRKPKNYPPSPLALPFIGHLYLMDFKDPIKTVQKLTEKYGNIFSTHVGGTSFVFVSGQQLIKEVLINQGEVFMDRPDVPLDKEIFSSKGLISSNGLLWKQQRRFTLSTLRNFGLGKRSLEERIQEECQYLVDAFGEEQENPFNPHFQLTNAVSNIICSITFGNRAALSVCLPLMQLLVKGDSSNSFQEENLVACVLDLLFAGTETTATTLRWALLYMAIHPEIQARVQSEIDLVIRQMRQPALEDRDRMPYTNAVIHEVQRIGNIIPFNVPRAPTKDTVVGGYTIPKGTFTMINLTSLMLDMKEWETPHTFNPGHFLKDGQFQRKELFIPFSMGK
ncbi:CP2U1 protein, partial [Ramphastos sulfuratus]|nr:CP2U1 protein [Ramphastos sulfuratus]